MQKFPENQWSLPHAAHLLNRAGFGGNPEEIQSLFAMGHQGAVEHLISGITAGPVQPPPEEIEPVNLREMLQTMRDLPEEERQTLRRRMLRQSRGEVAQLRNWWLENMRHTPAPLSEKMRLFWHGHFATSIRKVREPYLMLQQLETLHGHAGSPFPDLVKAISRDPAMLVWLDGARSRKDNPNENFARELMELFTLGEGHYTEEDILETARAFTGYQVHPLTRTFRLNVRQQDREPKKIFGITREFTGDMVIDAITQKEECRRFLSGKLWNFFASDSITGRPLTEFADVIRAENFAMDGVLRRLFSSSAFYDASVMENQIKSPVQWLMQLTRAFEIPLPQNRAGMNQFQQLGQVLLDPPNVRGWIGGRAWITPSSFVQRQNLAKEILTSEVEPETCAAWIESVEPATPAAAEIISSRVFCRPSGNSLREKVLPVYAALHEEEPETSAMNFAIHLTSLPEYQLT